MNKRKSVVLLVLMFLLVAGSVFAARGNQNLGRNTNEADLRGRALPVRERNVSIQENSSEELLMNRRMVRQNSISIDETKVLPEDCLYLETGERQGVNQSESITTREQMRQDNRRQAIDQDNRASREQGRSNSKSRGSSRGR